ncbi:RodZ domain-containing protein [Salinactinospora qingdaonensis]|uniref:RodZ domain-containing protein n=1 Tax=Salinactinospora qingdaonensis TaxID=702744 RepID=UPI003CD05614
MGRHRNDPRGVGQLLAIVGVVVLFIALVVLGGYFLYRSLPGNGELVVPDDSAALTQPEETAAASSLYIRVLGESSDILVRVPGGKVLTDTTMQQGQYVTYDQPRLDVTIGAPGAVEVFVNGQEREVADEPPGYSFTVKADSSPRPSTTPTESS